MTKFTSRPKWSIGKDEEEKYFLSLSGIKFLFSGSPTHSPFWQKKWSTFLSRVPPTFGRAWLCSKLFRICQLILLQY